MGGSGSDHQDGALTAAQAGAKLGVTPNHVTWMVARGHVEAVKVDGRLQVDPASVARLVEDRRRWVSYDEAAEMIGCTRATVVRMLHDGHLVGRPRLGARPCVDRASVKVQVKAWPIEEARLLAEAERRAAERAASRPPDDGHVYFDGATTAAVLGVSRTWVIKLARRGLLPCMQRPDRQGGRRWFRRDHVELVAAARAAASAQQDAEK